MLGININRRENVQYYLKDSSCNHLLQYPIMLLNMNLSWLVAFCNIPFRFYSIYDTVFIKFDTL